MKLSTSLVVGSVIMTGVFYGLVAIADAQRPAPLPPAPPDLLAAVAGHFKALMALIRGNQPIPAPLVNRTNEIIDYIARRSAAKIWPAVTKNELETLYEIARSA